MSDDGQQSNFGAYVSLFLRSGTEPLCNVVQVVRVEVLGDKIKLRQ